MTEVYQKPKKLAELQLKVVETFVVISTRVTKKMMQFCDHGHVSY